jgi:hypothetical protein
MFPPYPSWVCSLPGLGWGSIHPDISGGIFPPTKGAVRAAKAESTGSSASIEAGSVWLKPSSVFAIARAF